MRGRKYKDHLTPKERREHEKAMEHVYDFLFGREPVTTNGNVSAQKPPKQTTPAVNETGVK